MWVWSVLIDSLLEEGEILAGQSLEEWLCLCNGDMDDVDRFLLDFETIGG